jgi:hypothetical protein
MSLLYFICALAASALIVYLVVALWRAEDL